MFSLLKRSLGPRICSLVPLDFWHRLLEIEIVLPYYHVVSNERLAHISGLYEFRNIRRFKADLEYFLGHYTPVALRDLVVHLNGGRRLPNRCFLLTFDDGFREVHDIIAPILYQRGVPAGVFLITAAIDNRQLCFPQKKSLLICALYASKDSTAKREVAMRLRSFGGEGADLSSRIRAVPYREQDLIEQLGPIVGCDFAQYAALVRPYLTSDQVLNLVEQGFFVGAHSVDHPRYSELSLEEQLYQTRQSIRFLSSLLHQECQSFAFPFTDSGVSFSFYQRIFADGNLQVSFGTGGMSRQFYPRNLGRFTMERTRLPAAQVLARQFARTLVHKKGLAST